MSPGIILVIDDDECILNLTKAILVNAGYEVRTSTNSIEANRYIFCPTPPSLIIIDYMMPLASGDNKINLLAAQNTSEQHSKDSSSSASIVSPFQRSASSRIASKPTAQESSKRLPGYRPQSVTTRHQTQTSHFFQLKLFSS